MPDNKESRIAIIGAGPAGLTAAETLRELGYKNVTIFEKRKRVGGQSLSKNYVTPDNRTIIYEMGSVQPTSSPLLYRYIDENGLHIGKNNLGQNHSPDEPVCVKFYSSEQRKPIQDFTRYKFGKPLSLKLILDFLKLGFYLFKYRKLKNPGFTELSDKHTEELSIPYDQWIKERKFYQLEDALISFGLILTFANPSARQNLSALELVKFIISLMRGPYNRIRYINGQVKLVREGYEELWNRIAKKHQVIFDAHVTKINRKQDEIEIESGNQKQLFDQLIVACSLTDANQFLDTSEEEKELFKKMRHFPGWRTAFLGKNLPHDAAYIFPEPYLNIDHPPILQAFYPEGEIGQGLWLYSGVINLPKNEALEPAQKRSEKMLKDLFNGEIIKWEDFAYWPEYGANFSCEDLRNGIYKKLENLQGKNNTYYVGMSLAFGTHALVVEYTHDRIKKFFK